MYRSLARPAAGGIGQAHAIARAYGSLATGGQELGLTPSTLAAHTAPPVLPPGTLTEEDSLSFAGPDAQFGFGYVMNRAGQLMTGPRALSLLACLAPPHARREPDLGPGPATNP
ncbi:hypothetical protein [Stigmatella hybrida]|uniref:hypothetical protein n=1 Tax=Stigmatella hybrida TaxID=394097 RepID=UPI001CDAB310|nr:hypothetical protein [Stigmatella hybrida]